MCIHSRVWVDLKHDFYIFAGLWAFYHPNSMSAAVRTKMQVVCIGPNMRLSPWQKFWLHSWQYFMATCRALERKTKTDNIHVFCHCRVDGGMAPGIRGRWWQKSASSRVQRTVIRVQSHRAPTPALASRVQVQGTCPTIIETPGQAQGPYPTRTVSPAATTHTRRHPTVRGIHNPPTRNPNPSWLTPVLFCTTSIGCKIIPIILR